MDNAFDYESWLSVHTGYCQRHRCRLTAADCDKQRLGSQGECGDLRCQGCGGLDNQPETVDEIGEYGKARPLLQLVKPFIVEESGTSLPSLIREQSEQESCLPGGDEELARELQRLFFENEDESAISNDDVNETADCLDEDDFEDEIMRLFPELREFIEESEPELIDCGCEIDRERIGSEAKHGKKYAVYMGRCKRCGGYMDNIREMQFVEKWDDDVYRCLACGWRTSPAYAWNRVNPHLAGWKG